MKFRKPGIYAAIAVSSLLSLDVNALSPEGERGKQHFAVCDACHNPALDPPLAPPMWGVQRRYKRMAQDKEHFVELVAGFAKAPSEERAIFAKAVKIRGLMPPVPLPDEDLRHVATYIWEEQFPPPCAHWEIGAVQAEKSGDMAHAAKDRRMLERFCGQ